MSDYKLGIEENASPEDVKAVIDGLNDYNSAYVQNDNRDLKIFLRNGDGRVAGGLLGNTVFGWLHVSMFWLEDEARRQGLGSKLLAMAEDEARKRGCKYVFLNTFSFQARPFYEKLGYECFATQADFPLGYESYAMKKAL
jgi:GNAT superfamily N-acetyltransferase